MRSTNVLLLSKKDLRGSFDETDIEDISKDMFMLEAVKEMPFHDLVLFVSDGMIKVLKSRIQECAILKKV